MGQCIAGVPPVHISELPIMKLSVILLCTLVLLAVIASCEGKRKKKEAGPCTVKDCKKCNLTGKKCKVCNTGLKPKQRGRKCGPKPCFVNPCQNGGTCKFNKGKKKEVCKCKDGFTGAKCEIEDIVTCSVANCVECNAKGNKCLVCEEGYKKKRDGSCQEIIIPDCIVEHCLQCTETGKRCEEGQCEDGYKRDRK